MWLRRSYEMARPWCRLSTCANTIPREPSTIQNGEPRPQSAIKLPDRGPSTQLPTCNALKIALLARDLSVSIRLLRTAARFALLIRRIFIVTWLWPGKLSPLKRGRGRLQERWLIQSTGDGSPGVNLRHTFQPEYPEVGNWLVAWEIGPRGITKRREECDPATARGRKKKWWPNLGYYRQHRSLI